MSQSYTAEFKAQVIHEVQETQNATLVARFCIPRPGILRDQYAVSGVCRGSGLVGHHMTLDQRACRKRFDGTPDTTQDCELKAFRSLARRLKNWFPHRRLPFGALWSLPERSADGLAPAVSRGFSRRVASGTLAQCGERGRVCSHVMAPVPTAPPCFCGNAAWPHMIIRQHCLKSDFLLPSSKVRYD